MEVSVVIRKRWKVVSGTMAATLTMGSAALASESRDVPDDPPATEISLVDRVRLSDLSSTTTTTTTTTTLSSTLDPSLGSVDVAAELTTQDGQVDPLVGFDVSESISDDTPTPDELAATTVTTMFDDDSPSDDHTVATIEFDSADSAST